MPRQEKKRPHHNRRVVSTHSDSLSAHASEAAVLLALVTCPSLLIPFADNPFEPHKAAFLWLAVAASSGALLFAPAWRLREKFGRFPRLLLPFVTVALLAVVISTLGSEAPALSWWGSPLRRFGALTDIA